MTRKRSRLWLHKTKSTRHHRKQNTSNWSESLLNVIFVHTPTKESNIFRKHFITPSKDRTPKHIKLQTFQTPEKALPLSPIQVENVEDNQPLPFDNVLLDENIYAEDIALFSRVLHKLESAGHATDFRKFLELVDENKFPLDNLSFLLFLETVRFMATKITSLMMYGETKKRFWKTGYRLFHAKFLYFMGGPKNIGHVSAGIAQPGMALTEKSKINFAVPSTNVISDFNISEVQIPKVVQPGVLEPILRTLRDSSGDNEYMLCADGKKVTSGIDSRGGDVDMFGHEIGQKFSERKEKHERNLASIMKVKEKIQNSDKIALDGMNVEMKENFVSDLQNVVTVLGHSIKECRQLALRQTFGLNKFKEMAGENWKESRYVYVISGLQASLYQLREFISNALDNIGSILSLCTYFQRSNLPYIQDYHVDPSKQANIAVLKDTPDDVTEIQPRFIKQRSDIWFALRKRARVTGSTMHSAIGLRGLKEQKTHFSIFLEGAEESVTHETELRMQHGVKHEINAVATLIGRFLPAYYPDCIFTEEGCYTMTGESYDVLSVVSPDGSIRSSLPEKNSVTPNVVAAVEIKCPFPSDKQLSVHYSLPEYYVCQCLAEKKVLKTNQLFYVSYSEASTTVLRVTFSSALWELIWNEVTELYDSDNVKKPIKSRPQTKEIKEKIKEFLNTNVELICEIPSCKMSNENSLTTVAENDYFLKATLDDNGMWHNDVIIDSSNICCTMSRSKEVIENGYNLLRQKATEVMVWVVTNKNRNSSLEIPCSLPVAYGLKDYKLTSDLMRSATDHVLNKCRENGLRILSVATDGQWIKLMSRDSKDNPLTVFQLQKDTWNSTKSLSKQDLVKRIDEIIKKDPSEPLKSVNMIKRNSGEIEVCSKEKKLSLIETPNDKELWSPKRKAKERESRHEQSETEQTAETNWLPESVLNNLAKDTNTCEQLQSAITDVSEEIMRSLDTMDEVTAVYAEGHENDMDVDVFFEMVTQVRSTETAVEDFISVDVEMPNVSDNNLESSLNAENIKVTGSNDDQTSLSQLDIICGVITLDEQLLSVIVKELKANDSKKCFDCTVAKISELLSSVDRIKSLRHRDLNVIYECLETRLEEKHKVYRKSWIKVKKVHFVCGMIGLKEFEVQKTVKRKTTASLRLLSMKAIQSKKFPKIVIRVAYTRYVFDSALKEWQQNAPLQCPMPIADINETIPFWFSYPEDSEASGYWLCKSIDCSHNLTHLRVLTSTVGVCGISSLGWKECAKSNETALTIPLVEDLIDKQSVSNARTHFSLTVENWLRNHEFFKAADLTKLVREWYEASDDPGIPATDRLKSLISMRNFLLENIDFTRFPPTGRYFKGVPVVTFEGMLIDIDSKIQLHLLTHSYNIRSVGSLAAETTVGLLQTLYPTTQVSIKARDVPTLMSSVVEVMTCKSNSKRGFEMRTSRTSGVYPDHEGDSPIVAHMLPELQTKDFRIIIPRNHDFDMPKQKKSKRKIKFGKVSGPMAPSKEALPVRQYHKTDESKILPTKRLGLTSNDVDL